MHTDRTFQIMDTNAEWKLLLQTTMAQLMQIHMSIQA